MMNSLKRFWGHSAKAPTLLTAPEVDPVIHDPARPSDTPRVLTARVRVRQQQDARSSAATDNKRSGACRTDAKRTLGPVMSHRERLLSMRIEHLRLVTHKRQVWLASAGFITAGDLATCRLEHLAKQHGWKRRTRARVRRLQRAIRMAASIDGMMPRDAMLLIAIHRRDVQALACETAAGLRRDLERFALSSRGERFLGTRHLPSLRRLKEWIRISESIVARRLHGNVVPPPVARAA
ncbi:MAG: DUF4332 domain-containing protein [Planctomycetota bacterium]